MPVKVVRNSKKAPTFKQELAHLRKFFKTANTEEQRKLWNVLTALRGPDNNNCAVKHATTAVIRHAFLGSKATSSKVASYLADVAPDSEQSLLWRGKSVYDLGGDHFVSHASRAFTALDLSWDRVNNE